MLRDAPQIGRSIDKKDYYKKVREASKAADEKNLPFQFRIVKPKKANTFGYVCDCDEVYWVNRDTYLIQCNKCKELKKTADMVKLDDVSERKLEVAVKKYDGIEANPGPFTKHPKKSNNKGRWI